MHGSILLLVALAFIAAKCGAEVASRLKIPGVVGEIVAGIALGFFARSFPNFPNFLDNEVFATLAEIGVVVLLFQVGLESTVKDMLKVGPQALLVAFVGVAAPIVGGFFLGRQLSPSEHWANHLFLGATLCATSVGITARVFQELEISQTLNAKVVLGAAVIDDVLGLLVLSLLTGLVASLNSGADFHIFEASKILIVALVFLVAAVVLGTVVSKKVFVFASQFQVGNLLLPLSLAFCFLLATLSSLAGLAPLVGAYAAGLVLDDFHLRIFTEKGEHELSELLSPISQFFAPLFFVLMGAKVDVSVLAKMEVWKYGIALSVLAIVSKLIAGFVLPRAKYDRLFVGIAMIPRGEVGLIFAGIGANLKISGRPLLSPEMFSSVVFMVLVTTVAVPLLLKARLARMGPLLF